MPYNEQTYVYDPLDRQTFEAIAYNAIGRGSETNTYPAYRLTHSSGQSGWSVGFMQWDFGQRGRGQKVPELLDGYQAWATAGERFSAAEVASLTRRLQTPGQQGNALSDAELTRLNAYLRSDAGRSFVNGLDQEQIVYKWDSVGRPLADIPWLQAMRRDDPTQAAESAWQRGVGRQSTGCAGRTACSRRGGGSSGCLLRSESSRTKMYSKPCRDARTPLRCCATARTAAEGWGLIRARLAILVLEAP